MFKQTTFFKGTHLWQIWPRYHLSSAVCEGAKRHGDHSASVSLNVFLTVHLFSHYWERFLCSPWSQILKDCLQRKLMLSHSTNVTLFLRLKIVSLWGCVIPEFQYLFHFPVYLKIFEEKELVLFGIPQPLKDLI